MYEKQRDGFYYEVRDGMCYGRPLTEAEVAEKQATDTSNELLVRGVRHFRAQGKSWNEAAEMAAEGAITYLAADPVRQMDPASTDAFALRAAFQATARGLAAAERGL